MATRPKARRPPKRRLLRVLAGLLLAGSAGCTAWYARPPLTPRDSLDPRERLELWIGRERFDVHGVVLHGDSLTAVRFHQPPSCDSCVLRFALSAVDSVRTRGHSEQRTRGMGVSLLVLTVIALAVAVALAAAYSGATAGL